MKLRWILNFFSQKYGLIAGIVLVIASLFGFVYYITYDSSNQHCLPAFTLQNTSDTIQKNIPSCACSEHVKQEKLATPKPSRIDKKSQSNDSVNQDAQSNAEKSEVHDKEQNDSEIPEPTVDDELLDQLAAEQLMRDLAQDNEKNDHQQSEKSNDKPVVNSKQSKESQQSSDKHKNASGDDSSVGYGGNQSDAQLRNELDQSTAFAKQRFISEQARQALEESKAEVTRKIKEQIIGSLGG